MSNSLMFPPACIKSVYGECGPDRGGLRPEWRCCDLDGKVEIRSIGDCGVIGGDGTKICHVAEIAEIIESLGVEWTPG